MNPPSRLPFLLERLGTDTGHHGCSSSPPASSLDASALLKRRQARQAPVGQAGRAGGKQPRRLAPESALERLAASIVGDEDGATATAAVVGPPVAVAAPAPPLPVGGSSLRVLAGVDPRGPRVFGEPRAAVAAAAGVSSSRPVGAAAGATATATIRVSSGSGSGSGNTKNNKSARPPSTTAAAATASIAHLRFPPGKEHATAVASIAAAASQLPSRLAAPAALPSTTARRRHRPEPRQHLLPAAQQQHWEQQQQQDDPPPIRLDEYYSHYDDGAGTCDGDALGIAGSGEGGMGWEGVGRTTLGARHLADYRG